MRIKHTFCGWMLMVMMVGGVGAVQAASPPSVSLSYRGNLVAEPCTLLPEDESIAVEFGTVIDKYLYLNTRTLGKSFSIRLTECDLTLGKSVKVTFQGEESAALPGLIAVNLKGVAIGLETLSAKQVLINKSSVQFPLHEGNNIIELRAYVQGELAAIADKSIERGNFSSVAVFSLEYE